MLFFLRRSVNRIGYDITQISKIMLDKKNLFGTFLLDYRNFIGQGG